MISPEFCRQSVWFVFLVLVILSPFQAIAATPTAPANADSHLLAAATRAFADSTAFRDTRLFDCLGYTPKQVGQIAQITPRPAEVSVQAEPIDRARGLYKRLAVTCRKVRYYDMTIDHAVLEFPDIELAPEALREDRLVFRKVSGVRVETFVSSDDILKVFDLVSRTRQLSNLKMKIDERQTKMSGRSKQGMFQVKFSLSGVPTLDGIRKIQFQCRSLVLNGLKMPQSVVRGVFSRINPVFDANQTWLNLELEKIVLEKGFVRTQGWIKPPAPPIAQPPLSPVKKPKT